MQMQETLKGFAQSIYRHRILVSGCIIICTLLTFLISFLTPPTYEATTLVKVNTVSAISTNDVFSAQAATVDYALLVTSPAVFQLAARQLPGFTAGQLQHMVNDSPVDNTQIIAIQARAGTPLLAAKIADGVTSAFIQVQVTQETNRLQSTANGLSQRITQVRLAMSDDQQRLAALQNTGAIPTAIAQQKSVLDTDQANYNQLLASSAQLQIQKLQVANILSIVQDAVPPDQQSSPQVFVSTLSALLLSALFAMLLAFLLDWIDTTVRVASDIIQLELEPIGTLPMSSMPEQLSPLTMTQHGKYYPLKDAFTLLSTNVRVHLQKPQSMLVTSLCVGAGTSITTAHLAVQLAGLGVRVLLIDGNTQRPTLHTQFHCSNANGLGNLALLEQFHSFSSQPGWLHQWQTPVPNLWLLPVGPLAALNTSPFPLAELLRLKTSLFTPVAGDATLTNGAIDLILFDSAPLYENSTTITITTIVDATLLVIESGKEQRTAVQMAKETLRQLEAPIVGVVLNQLPARQVRNRTMQKVQMPAILSSPRPQPPQPLRESLPPQLMPIKTITPAPKTATVDAQTLPTGKQPTPSHQAHSEGLLQQLGSRLLLPSSQNTSLLGTSIPSSRLPKTKPPQTESQEMPRRQTSSTPFTPEPLLPLSSDLSIPSLPSSETPGIQPSTPGTRPNSLNISRHRREQLV